MPAGFFKSVLPVFCLEQAGRHKRLHCCKKQARAFVFRLLSATILPHYGKYCSNRVQKEVTLLLLVDVLALMPAILGFLFFAIVMFTEPRSLFSGASFLFFLGGCALSALFLLSSHMSWIETYLGWTIPILVGGAIAFAVIIVTFPLLLSLTFLIEGIRLIRKEGFSFSNCLSLGFSMAIPVIMIGLPWAATVVHSRFLTLLFSLAMSVITFLSLELALFVFSSMLNLIHLRKRRNLDQIVVLGSGIFEATVPPLLARRIDKGIELAAKNPNALLILSGGQGPGEAIPEGAAMKAYALAHGADPLRTISEERSKNTEENLLFSRKLFAKPNGKTAIVTTRYHVFRALILARRQNLKAVGFGSKTKWYFTFNALLREFIAWLSVTRKMQIRIILFLLLIGILFGVPDLMMAIPG